MALYSFLNGYPQPLPFRIEVDGASRTDPSTFTPEEIRKAGYVGPIEYPGYSPDTERVFWNGDEFEVVPLTAQELAALAESAKRDRIDYVQFWNVFKTTSVYQALRALAGTDLTANMLCTELLVALSEARAGRPDETIIGASFAQLFDNASFTLAQKDEMYAALKAGGLHHVFIVPDYVPSIDE